MKHLRKLLLVVMILICLVAALGCVPSKPDGPEDQTAQQPAGLESEDDRDGELPVLSVNAKEIYQKKNGTWLFYFDLIADRPLKEGEEYVNLTITLLKGNEEVKEYHASYFELDFGGSDRILLGAVTSYWLSAEEREAISDIDDLLVEAKVLDYRVSDFEGPRYESYIALDYVVYAKQKDLIRICTMTGEQIEYTHTIDAKMSRDPGYIVIGRIEFDDGSSILVHLPYDGPSGQLYKKDFDPGRIREFMIIPSTYVD